jgi:AraC-like DNA-binding protein
MDLFSRQQEALERLVPLFHFIGRNCRNMVHVGDAARICGLSESYFMSFFRRATGLSFVEYFKRYRIGRAQALLANTDDSMASISQEMGFCDQSHFGAVFRNAVGLTPLTYRRKFRKADSASREQPRQSNPEFGTRFPLPTPQRPKAVSSDEGIRHSAVATSRFTGRSIVVS